MEAVATGSPPATVQVTVSGFPGTMTSMNYSIPSDGSSVLNYTGIDDSVFSGNRTLTLTLNSTDTFVVVGTQSTATVMISEDDSKSLHVLFLFLHLPLSPSLALPPSPS